MTIIVARRIQTNALVEVITNKVKELVEEDRQVPLLRPREWKGRVVEVLPVHSVRRRKRLDGEVRPVACPQRLRSQDERKRKATTMTQSQRHQRAVERLVVVLLLEVSIE